MMTLIETLAQWCATPPVFSPRARELACAAIADTLGCMVAGRSDFSTHAVLQAWPEQPRSRAQDALFNATAAHAIDYDDNFAPGMSHASAVLLPALLAVAQDCDGEQLVGAYLIGLQAQAYVGEAVGYQHYTAGWHGTSTIGCIGSAAGVAALLGMDAVGIARTLSIAVSFASGVKGQFGTPLKPFHAGMAARNAVDAALLAQTGMHGRSDIIECEQGFAELYAGKLSSPCLPGEHEHVIERVGVMPKKYPCCGSTHRILDAIADIQQRQTLAIDDIESVHCQVGIANWRNLAYAQPQDEMQARFSMQYCVAVMLSKGMLSVSDFTLQRVKMQNAGARLATISMSPWTVEQEAESRDLPHIVTLRLKDGREIKHSRLHARGALHEPFSERERQEKFLDCCAQLDDAEAIYQRLMDLEQQRGLEFLRQLMV
jgi:2-methylcitrate dehydratase PrpD